MSIKRNWIGFCTIVKDELKRFLKIWPQTLVSSAVTITLYFVIFSSFTNTNIETLYHISYAEFIAPGLIMMAIIINSYGNVSFSLWNHRFQHSIEEVLVSPLPNSLILLGYTLGGILRGILVGLIVTLIALCFTHLSIHNLGLTLLMVICTSTLFALAGFTNALCADKFDDVLFVPNFVLTPLIYLGGVFYSIYQLPPFWQQISLFNPILYIINAFRYGILGITDVSIPLALGIILGSIVVLMFFNLYLLRKGVGIAT
ncbi:MAG: ABC transporter permease [Legionella sp.]|nr:MAG: ABC transporter permease [Legionella sp.]